ncbi:MAG TPA: PKD domain-containing protein [Thermoplasmatales archaeon]|nr:PKD domain-containing protein [Thermoplasmatales archaeon]HEX08298.1 PKD domain-containing protein [Thermoplasmatales archaeon]
MKKILVTMLFISIFISLSGCLQQTAKLNFDFAPTNPTTYDEIQFIAIYPNAKNLISAWLWDFGDGNTSTEQNPKHQYSKDGNYTVTLKAWKNDGSVEIISKKIIISTSPNNTPETPRLAFNSGVDRRPNLFYLFKVNSTDPDGDKISYLIDWGDGNSTGWTPHLFESGENAGFDHSWAKPGNYTIKAKAKDARGAESNWSEPVHIEIKSKKEAPDFTIKTIDGNNFTLSDYRGKIVILDFSSVSCVFCKSQLYEFKNISNKYGGEVVVISIFVQSFDPHADTVENVTKIREEIDADWLFALDTSETNVTEKFMETKLKTHEFFYIRLPKLFIINKEGFISFSSGGFIEEEKIAAELDKLI